MVCVKYDFINGRIAGPNLLEAKTSSGLIFRMGLVGVLVK